MTFTDPTPTIYERARTLRRIRGWSARELAERLTAIGHPVSRPTIAAWETRPAGCEVARLYALAAVFEITPSYLTDPDSGPCPKCLGHPPAGFTCNACGTTDPGARPSDRN